MHKVDELNLIQQEIDSVTYPENYGYQLGLMFPNTWLKSRLDIILSVVPDFFNVEGKECLDIGANKGFISIGWSKNNAFHVTAVDPMPECCKIMNDAKQTLDLINLEVLHGTFKEVLINRCYDIVYLGNVNHFLYKEFEGYWFVDKLAMLCKDLLVIEGPVWVYGPSKDQTTTMLDKSKSWTEQQRIDFTPKNFETRLNKYFTIEHKVPAYDTDRFVYVCVRKKLPELQFKDIRDNIVTKHIVQNDGAEKTLQFYQDRLFKRVLWNGYYESPRKEIPYIIKVINRNCYFTLPITKIIKVDRGVIGYTKPFIDGNVQPPVIEHLFQVLAINSFLTKLDMLWVDVAPNNTIVSYNDMPYIIDLEDTFTLSAMKKAHPDYYLSLIGFYKRTLNLLLKSLNIPEIELTPQDMITNKFHVCLFEKLLREFPEFNNYEYYFK
jgi:hypothetical protein